MQSRQKTIDGYIASLPEDRREVVERVRALILENLPTGYEEAMNWGMISYQIPLAVYPKTYNKQPLSYVALASQKNHYSLYLMALNGLPGGEEAFRKTWEKSGKKLDIGKSCIRFKKFEDLALDVLAATIASTTPDSYIKLYEQTRGAA